MMNGFPSTSRKDLKMVKKSESMGWEGRDSLMSVQVSSSQREERLEGKKLSQTSFSSACEELSVWRIFLKEIPEERNDQDTRYP